jgi:AcrR family transcriptional regulator
MPAAPRPPEAGRSPGEQRWRTAALRALATRGVSAVAIEPLARTLGVTKGSGYWHFGSREALLRAALDEWETKTTEDVIARLARVANPRERLAALLRMAFTRSLDGRVYLALAAAEGNPVVLAALKRVSQRRLAFLAAIYEELGFSPARALSRAVVAYAAYLGVVMLRRHAPEVASGRDRRAQVDHVIETLTLV